MVKLVFYAVSVSIKTSENWASKVFTYKQFYAWLTIFKGFYIVKQGKVTIL